MTKKEKIEQVLSRGTEEVFILKNLQKKLQSGKKLRIKHGIDPTGPKIHIGRAVQLWKLREFQELGHQIVLIIGDFTALIGDASDKQAKRAILTKKQIKDNMKNYLPQINKILDLKKAEVRYNSEWLGRLSALDLISLKMKFTAQQLIQRRNFKERWDEGKEIGAHELDYPILQGYDSVAIKADVEIGGSDQLFNLQAGRKIQEIFKQEPQNIMTTKMLIGLDGRKMSTSWGNVINILDEPSEMYGKIMSMRDNIMPEYFELATLLSKKEAKEILKTGPRNAKAKLAKEITAMYHGKTKAEKAGKEFDRVFKEKKQPTDMPEIVIKEKQISILDLLVKAGLAGSKGEAKRLIIQKGVKLNNKAQDDWQAVIRPNKGDVIQAGKRRFAKLK